MTPNRSHNILHEPLFDRNTILIPLLHIKLGLIKQFVEALDKNGDTFKYICRLLPSLTTGKSKASIFDGPQIWKLLKDKNMKEVMADNEAMA